MSSRSVRRWHRRAPAVSAAQTRKERADADVTATSGSIRTRALTAIVWSRGRSDGPKRASAATATIREADPMRTAHGEYRALDEELTGQAPARRAERRPDADLARTHRSAAEQQPGHIDARQEQHERQPPPASSTSVESAVPTISCFRGTADGVQGLFGVG